MVQYATAADLNLYLHTTIDSSTADLLLTLASGEFSKAANTWWAPQNVTYTTAVAGWGQLRRMALVLPFSPITAVSDVRVNGVSVTGYTLIETTLYRPAGFGGLTWYQPDKVEVDLTHGYAAATDDVRAAVLDMAAQAYTSPVGAVTSEQIDDYAVRSSPGAGGVQLTPYALDLANRYRGAIVL